MAKKNKTKKFAKIKRILNPKDKRIKENQEKIKKKEIQQIIHVVLYVVIEIA